MKKATKFLALMLCLALFTGMALGSGSSDEDTKEIVSETDSDVGSEEESDTADEESSSSSDVTIEETVLLEQDGIKITALEYVEDDLWGDGIKLLLENTSDKSVTVSTNALIVNNYMISDLFVSDISAGKKANEIMYLSSSALEAAGIDSVGQIEIYFTAYDTDSFDTIFNADCVTIQTSGYDTMDTTPDETGVELYNEGGIKIVGKTVDEDSFWGTAILLYSENTSGQNIVISVDEMSINGFMMEPFFSTTVYDGKMSFDEITIFSSDLEDNGIESIEDVELIFHIYDADSFDTIADSETITFSAE